MKFIESKSNPLIKKVISLKNTSSRKKHSLFIIEGIKSVSELLASTSWKILNIFFSKSFYDLHGIPVQYMSEDCIVVTDDIFKLISDTVTPQGILSVVHVKNNDLSIFIEKTKSNALYVACEAVQDPGNLGTIIRTAAAAGVDGVFLSKDCVDLFNPKVLRATMGSIFQMPVFWDVDLLQFVMLADEIGIQTIAAHLDGCVPHYDLDLKPPVAFFTGNEANGLTDELSNLCKTKSKLPILRQTESLNASVATGIFIYEALRQRVKNFS